MYHCVSRVVKPDLVRLTLACLTVVTTLPVGIRLVALVGGSFCFWRGETTSLEMTGASGSVTVLLIPEKPYHTFSIPGKSYHT